MRDKPNDPARLLLMLEAIGNIESFTEGISTYASFAANKILCHAVTYNLQCIGENVYKLSREFIEEHTSVDWEAIEGLRHVLVHDYYQVNLEMIWQIIEKDMPYLKEYLSGIVQDTQVPRFPAR